jgi:cytochrome c oxidase subunit 2
MRKITGNDKFDFVLLCNKICGVAHYQMKMKVVVETEEKYNEWVAAQKPFMVSEEAPQMAENMTASTEKTNQ